MQGEEDRLEKWWRERSEVKKWCCKGSFTVEASFVVPMAFMVIALMLVLCFFIHNRVYYSCAAYECCIDGNEKKGVEENKAQVTAELRVSGQAMPGSEPSISVAGGTGSTKVSFEGQVFPAFQKYIPTLDVSKTVKRIRPEKALRMMWAAQN